MAGQSVSAFFHGYAHGFDDIYGNKNQGFNRLVNRVFRRSMLLRMQKTLALCEPLEGKRVIDVGCGPGHYSTALAAAGASDVVGLDFAAGMIDLARRHAKQRGVQDRCRFLLADLVDYAGGEPFDYAVVMGLMDYAAQPRQVIEKVLSLTRRRAFFSFPAAGGLLAWQRKLRYRDRCRLFLYRRKQLELLFQGLAGCDVRIEKLARDFFVTVEKNATGDTDQLTTQEPDRSREPTSA